MNKSVLTLPGNYFSSFSHLSSCPHNFQQVLIGALPRACRPTRRSAMPALRFFFFFKSVNGSSRVVVLGEVCLWREAPAVGVLFLRPASQTWECAWVVVSVSCTQIKRLWFNTKGRVGEGDTERYEKRMLVIADGVFGCSTLFSCVFRHELVVCQRTRTSLSCDRHDPTDAAFSVTVISSLCRFFFFFFFLFPPPPPLLSLRRP